MAEGDILAAGGWGVAQGYNTMQFAGAGEKYPVIDQIKAMYQKEGKPVPDTIKQVGDEPVVRIPLPGVDRDQLSLELETNQLVLTLGAHRRRVTLPDTLSGRSVRKAGLRGEHLEITFAASPYV